METIPPPARLEFYLNRLLDYIIHTRISYDKAYKAIVARYRVPKWLRGTLYKTGYYAVLYYYGLKWVAQRHGYRGKRGGAIAFYRSIGYSVRRLEKILERETRGLGVVKRLSIRYSYPEYIVRDLLRHLEPKFLEEYLRRLNERRIWLRVNTLKTSVEEAIELLEKEGVRVEQDKNIPYLLRVVKPQWVKPSSLEAFHRGYVVPQDKASAIVSVIAHSIASGDLLDSCCAPGNKLALVMILDSNASYRYVGVDKSWKRILVTPKLMTHQGLGLYNVLLIQSDSRFIETKHVFSRGVVDAPCSGSGAVPGDPGVKVAIERRTKLDYYNRIQYMILRNILSRVDTVVYSVCSIHPLEGEEVIERITMEGYGEPVEIDTWINKAYRGYSVSDKTYRTYPYIDYSQGFYIAVLRSRR